MEVYLVNWLLVRQASEAVSLTILIFTPKYAFFLISFYKYFQALNPTFHSKGTQLEVWGIQELALKIYHYFLLESKKNTLTSSTLLQETKTYY